MDNDLACDYVGLGGFNRRPQFVGNEAGIVFVLHPVDSALGKAEADDAGRKLAGKPVAQGLVVAISTRLSMDVSTEPGARPFWFESTPMASLPASAAA